MPACQSGARSAVTTLGQIRHVRCADVIFIYLSHVTLVILISESDIISHSLTEIYLQSNFFTVLCFHYVYILIGNKYPFNTLIEQVSHLRLRTFLQEMK